MGHDRAEHLTDTATAESGPSLVYNGFVASDISSMRVIATDCVEALHTDEPDRLAIPLQPDRRLGGGRYGVLLVSTSGAADKLMGTKASNRLLPDAGDH